MYKIFLLLVSFSVSTLVFAQQTKKERKEQKKQKVNMLIRQEEEGIIAYNKQFVIGGTLTTDGYGLLLELGKAKSIKKSILFQFEITERKDKREEKIFPNNNHAIQPFFYGKQNFMYPVKLGVQMQTLLGNKSNKNGVSISANYGGGISLALIRPYMVQIVDASNNLKYIKFDSEDSTAFLDPTKIIRGPQFGTGWNQLQIKPGFYAKAAVRFDYGAFNETVSALEAGITGEFYTSKIPILVHNPAKQFFFSGYVTILFGKRK